MLSTPLSLKFLLVCTLLTACSLPVQLQTSDGTIINIPVEKISASVSQAEYSPDGRWLLWERRTIQDFDGFDNTDAWYLYDTRNNRQYELWNNTQEDVFKPKWASDNRLITCRYTANGQEPQPARISRIDPSTRSSQSLWQGTFAPQNTDYKVQNGQIAWLGDGRQVHLMPESGGTIKRFSLPDTHPDLVWSIRIAGITPEAILLGFQKSEDHLGQSVFKTQTSLPPPSVLDLGRISRDDGHFMSLATNSEHLTKLSPDGQFLTIFSHKQNRIIRVKDGSEIHAFPELPQDTSGQSEWLDNQRLLYWDFQTAQFQIYNLITKTASPTQAFPTLKNLHRVRRFGSQLIFEGGAEQTSSAHWLSSVDILSDGQFGPLKSIREVPEDQDLAFLDNQNGPLLAYQRPRSPQFSGELRVIEVLSGKTLFTMPAHGSRAEELKPAFSPF